MNYPVIAYIEVALMENGETIHYGKSLGFINEKQRELLESGATKMTKGSEPIIAVGKKNVA